VSKAYDPGGPAGRTPSAFRLTRSRSRQALGTGPVVAMTRNRRRTSSSLPELASKTAGSKGMGSTLISGNAAGSAARATAAISRASSSTWRLIGSRDRLSVPQTRTSRTSPQPWSGAGSSSVSRRIRNDETRRRRSWSVCPGGLLVSRRDMALGVGAGDVPPRSRSVTPAEFFERVRSEARPVELDCHPEPKACRSSRQRCRIVGTRTWPTRQGSRGGEPHGETWWPTSVGGCTWPSQDTNVPPSSTNSQRRLALGATAGRRRAIPSRRATSAALANVSSTGAPASRLSPWPDARS
jgi:hypothetical protein